MSWRSTQLGDNLCSQDQIILQLFNGQPVRYVGKDSEFAKHLICQDSAENLVLIINQPVWFSQLRDLVAANLCSPITKFYIGINRYCILGKNTADAVSSTGGHGILELLTHYVNQHGYAVESQGMLDNDQGRHFNFVQPLTWMYGTIKQSHQR